MFETFPATFYLEPLPVPVILDQLARTPAWLDQLLDGVSNAQAAQSIDGVEGAWSPREAVGHVLDTQELIAQRVELFLQHESPDLTAKAMWNKVESASLAVRDMALKFRQSRAAMLTRLHAATPAHWTRTGRHTEFGPVTLQQQCGYFAKHEQWHMAQMTRLKHAL
ncbi:MAG TPA: DinB family protein [Anaerolineae bacterium]|nr:DinB family protein [Anaerolineae bacterium]